MTAITLKDLTEAKLDGAGVFDQLMVAAKAHLDAEQKKGTIKGPEYSQVYIGQVQAILQTSVQFLFNQQKIGLEAQLLEQQIELAKVQVAQANAQIALIEAQTAASKADKALNEAQEAKVRAETLNVPKQGAILDVQKDNEVLQGKVLVAQECKLKAEFDLTQQSTLKAGAETDLLVQKVATEKAQILGLGVDDNSVVGRQKALYKAQTDGFTRDAEQKAAKIMIDSWNVRRTTDDGTVADTVNKLNDANIGRAVDKLLGGVGA